jgi:alpha,alpha-trehalose phosphorylase
VTKTEASYTILDGPPLEIAHHGEAITVSGQEPVTRAIPPAVERPTPSQPPGRAPAQRGKDTQ